MGCEPRRRWPPRAPTSAALGAVDDAWRATATSCVLTGDGVELRFTPRAPVPDSALVGTGWVLETLVEGEMASSTLGEPAVLLLDADGTSAGVHRLPDALRHLAASTDGALVVDDLLADGGPARPTSRRPGRARDWRSWRARPDGARSPRDRLTLTAADGRAGSCYREPAG